MRSASVIKRTGTTRISANGSAVRPSAETDDDRTPLIRSDRIGPIRRRRIELYESGRCTFALNEQPTDIVTGDDIQSCYAHHVYGPKFGFTFAPSDVS
jgi:hypothetical protein